MHKPGEKAPRAGTYYCYVCSLKGIDSDCELQAGAMFVACARCVERKVAEWDMSWKASAERPDRQGRSSRTPSPWPGSLQKPA